MNRREFLKSLGLMSGGIIIYFNMENAFARERVELEEDEFAANVPKDFNAFLRIGSDGRVTLLTGKSEMGQGPITSLPQMLAEELDVPYDSVDIVMGDTDLCPWDMGTFGSLTTQVFGAYLRDAASEAKGVLKELAADYLKCPIGNLLTKDGILFDKNDPDRSVTYGQITKGKTIEKHLKDLPPLKPVSEFTVMGKPYLRRDSHEKVTGKAKYAGDLRFPDMLYARVLRPPAHGARLKSVDVTEAEKMEGIMVIQDNDLIAVLHRYPDMAEKALTKIKAEFDMPETGLDDNNIFRHLVNMAPEEDVTSHKGNLETGQKQADTVIEETYYNSYVAHAPIEPHTSVATVEHDKITIWSATQSPFLARMMVTGAMGLPDEKVRIITPVVGGGFGGKNSNMEAVEAARLAKLTGRTVQVGWSRGEEFFYDSFRPAAVVKIKSGMRNDGKIVFWDYCVYFAGERGSTHCYNIPHNLTVARGEWMEEDDLEGHVPAHPFGVGPWRAPANNTNTYARELHINIMAAKAGIDPLEFRLINLKDERMIRVLKQLAREFGWTPSKIPSGRGYGLACGIDAGTYVAHIAEVDVDKRSGKVKVNRVACAQDMGLVVNPAGAKAQMEGCITMGLGYALTEEIRFKNGEIFDLNFDTYDIPRFSWLPKIETVFVENSDLSPKGGGEPAIVCMGAVIASAIYDATGAVVHQLPMTPERVKRAIEGL